MTFSGILFHFFSICLVISTSIVVTSKHPIFSIVFLAISFIFSSLLLFLLECEFLALLFLVIYLGAILVLFLFAVMMLEFKSTNLLINQIKHVPVGLTFSFLLFSCFLANINLNYYTMKFDFNYLYLNTYQNWYHLTDCIKDVQIYGQVLYSYYVLQFLISGLILMLVLISVVYLTNSSYNKQTKEQSAFKQLSKSLSF